MSLFGLTASSGVGRFFLWKRKLGVEGMSVLGSVLRNYDHMKEVVLRKCELQAHGMKSFAEGLFDVKIKILDISESMFQGKDVCKTIGSIVQICRVEELKMNRLSKLSRDEVKGLCEGLNKSKVKILEVSENENMEGDVWRTIGSMVQKCQIEALTMRKCELSVEEIAGLHEGLACSKVKILDVSQNKNIGPRVWRTVGSIVENCEVEDLNVSECHLTTDEIDGLQCGLANSKIKILSVSGNQNLGNIGWRTFGSIVHKCQVEELNMWKCKLSTDEIEGFHCGLTDSKIRILDVNGNQNFGTDVWRIVGSIVQKCQVQELKMSRCKLSTEGMIGLQDGLANSKIKLLDLSMNGDIESDVWKTVGSIVENCQIEELKMSRCRLSTGGIKSLHDGLSHSKITVLRLSIPYELSRDELQAVADLVRRRRQSSSLDR